MFTDWETDLNGLKAALSTPIESFPKPQWQVQNVSSLLLTDERISGLSDVRDKIREKYPEASPEQKAWDMLTRFEENEKAIETARKSLFQTERINQRTDVLYEKFIENRDAVLGKLYEDIKDRFVELYKAIHGPDEQDFSAKLTAQEAQLNFEVDFHGRGNHPPHALHSEGHQDSMGLCLYLALSEKLTKGLVDVVILDDVVTSVDTDHRKQVCKLLKQYFPSKQFIITTHERVWANQLRSEGIVTSAGMVEFYNWHVDTGPTVSLITDLWDKIGDDLIKSDVSTAAGRLRRGLEQFMAMMCDYLGAPIIYRLDGRYELGDFMSAIGRYKKLLEKARNTALSWENATQVQAIQDQEKIFSESVVKTQCEQWAINPSVHYTEWANFSINDFKPLVDSFKKLTSLFICGICNAPIHVVMENHDATMIKCDCGKIGWSLIKKQL